MSDRIDELVTTIRYDTSGYTADGDYFCHDSDAALTDLATIAREAEAERDALLAEHEAITMMLPLCGLDWKEEGCDDPCDVCSLPPVHAAHDNAERVIRGE